MRGRLRDDAAWLTGVGSLLLSYALGSHTLAALGLGLVVAGGAARLATQAAVRTARIESRVGTIRFTEGATVVQRVDLTGLALGLTRRLTLDFDGIRLQVPAAAGRVEFDLSSVRRGRYPLTQIELEAVDLLGLCAARAVLPLHGEIIVRPLVPEITAAALGGLSWQTGTRRRMRSAGGLDVLGVREHAPGEPLRAVHWPTTARRGSLMVRELAESRRVDTVVAIDTAGGFERAAVDVAVRAGAAVVRAVAAEGRRVLLLLPGGRRPLTVESLGGEWDLALDELAGVTGGGDVVAMAERVARTAGAVILVTLRFDQPVAALAARTGASVIQIRGDAQGAASGAFANVLERSATRLLVVDHQEELSSQLTGTHDDASRRATG